MDTGSQTPENANLQEHDILRSQLQSKGVMLFVTLASIGDAVITTDNVGEITFLNPVAEKLSGWNLADAIGLPAETVFRITQESGECMSNPVRAALETGAKVNLPEDAVLVRKDGSTVPIEDSASPIQGASDETLGIILVFRDVSARKEAEKMVKYRAQLDQIVARISTSFATARISNLDNIIDDALGSIGKFLGASRTQVYTLHRATSSMRCTHEWHAEGAPQLINVVHPISLTPLWVEEILKRKPVVVSGLQDIPEDAVEERKIWEERSLKSMMLLPMSQGDRVLGFICVDSLNDVKPWSSETQNMLYMVANVIASAIARRNAENKLEAARAREVEIGSRIQQSLLLSPPPLNSAHFKISALSIPSKGIDGDFYDFLLHPNHCLDVIFGDVMGKGLPAALLSAGAKTEFLRSLSHLLVASPRGTIPKPEDIVNDVHRVLTPQLKNLDSFVTLSYVRFDPRQNQLTLVDCGSPRLIRCPWESGSPENLSGYNLPLGFSESEIYSEAVMNYEAGDLFVMYSDGITEAHNPEGKMYGIQRLLDIIRENHRSTPDQIMEAVQRSVTDFVETRKLSDDLTCVIIRVLADAPRQAEPASDEMVVASKLENLGAIREFFRSFCESSRCTGLTEHELNLIELALNEVVSNIIRHAYHGRTDKEITVRIDNITKDLRIRLTHDGEPFSGSKLVSIPSLEGAREGGLGLFIINRSIDTVEYGQDTDSRQYIELIKKCRNQRQNQEN